MRFFYVNCETGEVQTGPWVWCEKSSSEWKDSPQAIDPTTINDDLGEIRISKGVIATVEE